MIPYGRQEVTEDDIAAVVDVLRSEFLTQGPAVPCFEAAVRDRVGARHAVAANSATSALHLACLALGLGPGDRLWTSPITFVASANCGRYVGADVDFVDIDPRSYNLDPVALETKLVLAEREGRLPKVVVAVHLCGQPCEMADLHALSRRYGFRLIEDASHALGARYRGEPVGCGRWSDITVFSFHPVKIITTAEGGMAVTQDEALARTMALLRSHGITRESEAMDRAPDGPWYYQQLDLGFNYRMTDLQAALGLSQVERLTTYIARRNALAERYDRLLADLPVHRPWRHPDALSAFHLYVVQVEETRRRGIFEAMRGAGIGVNLHYIPVHTQPYYAARGFRPGDFPEAERYYARALSLPLFATLTEGEQDRVVEALARALHP